MARTKDDRRIVKGVQLPMHPRDADGEIRKDDRDRPMRASTFEVFTEGQEDELEAFMTPEQLKYLKKQGAIEGDGWKPGSGDIKAVQAVLDAKEQERQDAEKAAQAAEPEKKPAHAAHPTHHSTAKVKE